MNKQRLLRVSMLAASLLFIICIPFLLLTSNLRWAVNDLQLYQYGFDKYHISQETGFSDEELTNTAKGLIKYFNSGEIGSTLSIFSDNGIKMQREIAHLRDVRALLQLCYTIQYATLGYIILFLAAGFAWKRRQFLPAMYRLFVYGSILSIMALAAVGIAALIDFDGLFMAFHHLFFTGDTFVLTYLPSIFTEDFFSDAAKFIAIAIIIEAIFIGAITGGSLLRYRRKSAT